MDWIYRVGMVFYPLYACVFVPVAACHGQWRIAVGMLGACALSLAACIAGWLHLAGRD